MQTLCTFPRVVSRVLTLYINCDSFEGLLLEIAYPRHKIILAKLRNRSGISPLGSRVFPMPA